MNAPASLTDQVLSPSELKAKGYDHSNYTYKKSGQYARDYTEAEVRQQGLALLKGIDNGVGDILNLLEANGELDNTIIFFIGDNGAPAGNKSWDGSMNDPWHGSKGIIFEGGSRIPYIVYWPSVIEPQVFEQGVSTLDAGATAVALAGLDPSQDPLLDGVNLLPFLTGEASGEPHRYLYQRFLNTASVVQGKYKYMRHDNGEELLFDVSMGEPGVDDANQYRHEAVNLLNRMPEKADELSKELDRWMGALPKSPYEGQGWHSSLYQFIKQRWGFQE
jgi:arylsulfatase A-like enzyme